MEALRLCLTPLAAAVGSAEPGRIREIVYFMNFVRFRTVKMRGFANYPGAKHHFATMPFPGPR
jgi:hypothetical protein